MGHADAMIWRQPNSSSASFFLHNFPDCVDLSPDDLSRCKKLFRPAIVAAFTLYPNPPPDLNKKFLLMKMILQTFKADA